MFGDGSLTFREFAILGLRTFARTVNSVQRDGLSGT